MSAAPGDRPEGHDRRTAAWVTLGAALVLTAGAVTSVWLIWVRPERPEPRQDNRVPTAPGPDNSVTSSPGLPRGGTR